MSVNAERPKPLDADKLMIQRLSGELSELKHWIAVLIAVFGHNELSGGAQLVILQEEAEEARTTMGYTGIPEISVTFDDRNQTIVMDAL